MITDYSAFIERLRATGRMKLLPQVLRELKISIAREQKLAPKTETAKQNPSLISGSRTLANGTLEDTTGKQALLEIYQRITS